MASINYATREISCKIVYYGPGLSGKTTNLQIIHRKIPDKDKSEMVSLATETDRTLFFDFLPLDLGSIKGFSTKFQLYTVPGQVYYNATRKLVLRGVDGVVFVVDSQVDKLQENLESFANLQENLREYGHSIENIPLVLQFNKRDLPNVYPVQQLNALINKHNLPYYEAVAATGVGVFTTLKAIGKSVIDKFNAKYAGFQGGRRPATPAAPQRPAAPAPGAAPAFGGPAPAANPGAFGGAPQRPAAPQPFPGTPGGPPAGGFGAPPAGFGQPPAQPRPMPAVPPMGGFGSPAPGGPGAPPAGAPGGNPFLTQPPGMPTSAGFPGPLSPGKPPAQGPGGFAPPQPPAFGGAAPANAGFGSSNPFAGSAPAAPKPGFPGAPSGGPGGPGGFPAFPGPKPPGAPAPLGGIPQQAGNSGFQPPQGIPVSPFVDSFSKTGGAPGAAPGGFGTPANPFGAGGPPASNPFSSPAKPPQPMPGFGAPPASPAPGALGGGFASPFPGAAPGATGSGFGSPSAPAGGAGGFGGPTLPMNPPGPGFGGSPTGGFGAPAPGGFGGPASGGFGNAPAGGFGSPAGGPGSAFPPSPQGPKGGTPFPSMEPPAPPGPSGQRNAGIEDASGIVTTFEDLQKDDSFKTKKLPHPNEKKKGFFDGLFRKDK